MKIRLAALVLAASVATVTAPAAAPAPAAPDSTTADTLSRVVPIAGVEVSTTRPGDRAPLARTTLERAEIAKLNWGQATPKALAGLPGAFAYSDAGNGIGYSYLSIRGFPQRRISVLVNGVPLNDPESHEVYWIDHPDLLASTAEAQVQRGVGSALYGAASLGGSVDLETAPFSEVPRAAASLSYGSYETKRLMAEMNSGHLSGNWGFYGRYSRIETQGYRDQSWSRLWSYAVSARKVAGRQSLRINLYGGPEETHLAYLGTDAAHMDGLITGDRDRDRRDNPLTYAGERDHFFEPHYELIHTWSPHDGLSFTHTLFYFDGKGYYDEHRVQDALTAYRLSPWPTYDPTLFGADSLLYYLDANHDGVLDRDAQGRVTVVNFNLVRRRIIADRQYGWVPRMQLEHGRGTLTIGGEIRAHDGRHYGDVAYGEGLPPGTPPDFRYYDYHPRTLAAGLFAREQTRLSPALLLTADLGWRHQSYFMEGDQFDNVQFTQGYDFAEPRLGLSYAPRPSWSAFASWSYAAREPALRDLYDGESVGNVPNYALVNGAPDYSQPLVRPEDVNDFELGATWHGPSLGITTNLFRMNFRDEQVYAGQFNSDLGYPVTGNAAQSIHQGIELSANASTRPGSGPRLTLDANATLSDNHFIHYTEFDPTADPAVYEKVVLDGKTIGFFPGMLANAGVHADWKVGRLGAQVHYAGRQYLDNSESTDASLGPHATVDLDGSLHHTLAGIPTTLTVRVMNVPDDHYANGGYAYRFDHVTYSSYIPAATRNALAELRIDF